MGLFGSVLTVPHFFAGFTPGLGDSAMVATGKGDDGGGAPNTPASIFVRDAIDCAGIDIRRCSITGLAAADLAGDGDGGGAPNIPAMILARPRATVPPLLGVVAGLAPLTLLLPLLLLLLPGVDGVNGVVGRGGADAAAFAAICAWNAALMDNRFTLFGVGGVAGGALLVSVTPALLLDDAALVLAFAATTDIPAAG